MPSQQAARQPFAVKFNVKTNQPRRPDVMKNLGRNNTEPMKTGSKTNALLIGSATS